MIATRKLPVRINEKKRTTFRHEYLLPVLSGVGHDGFISIKTGNRVERGAMVYVGVDVTPEMLLGRFIEAQSPPKDRSEALRRLVAFVEELQRFKIGNVLTVSYASDGLPFLQVVEEYFLGRSSRRLP